MKIKVPEWNKRESPPEDDCLCYVTNIHCGGGSYLALYSKYRDFFWLYDPKAWDHPALDVTHYIVLPAAPREYEENPPVMEVRFKKSMSKKTAKTEKPKK